MTSSFSSSSSPLSMIGSSSSTQGTPSTLPDISTLFNENMNKIVEQAREIFTDFNFDASAKFCVLFGIQREKVIERSPSLAKIFTCFDELTQLCNEDSITTTVRNECAEIFVTIVAEFVERCKTVLQSSQITRRI
jgi:hypothetical protein